MSRILEDINEYLKEKEVLDLPAKPPKVGQIYYSNGGLCVGKFKGKFLFVAPEKYEIKGNMKKATSYCSKFSIETTSNFSSKWHLPTIEELKFIYGTGLGDFKKDFESMYWSSTNQGGVNYSVFTFKDGTVGVDEQKIMRLIRPVCVG